ncbi:DEAD-box ATP-dependent RNA helicase 41 [Dendrobium catenatum]|nr:DEAD-box ATP-dependent RNA helicase 41 [Dendrobium catenatum]XP_020676412.1 DEAD-box ATP-dependent RNA helicase 41 [Dendrobium catenatum]XP_020676414.1 DEAD-box ATP-dependent RNA helicase 41 [Dendrobium catenatum]
MNAEKNKLMLESLATVDTNEENTDSPVKERCKDQREALPGEPRCVKCGRYGEYICDETDNDICSKECKQILLSEITNDKKQTSNINTVKVPANDECFYVRDNRSRTESLNINQIESLRKKLGIHIRGESVPGPIFSFSSCNLPKKLEENLENAGYELPTPIQMQAIPAALLNRNLIISADTGSGKTASFLVPIISLCSRIPLQHLRPCDRRPLAMVLAPTRELCIQLEDQAKILAKGLPFKTALVVGGVAMASQVHRIQNGIELIIGTPGRLIDLLSKHNIELDEVSMFVLDEVDCILQRGFRDQVMQIFKALSHPQLLMVSATISHEVDKMASFMTKNLTYVLAGNPNIPTSSVKQIVIWIESKLKKKKLFEILTSKQHFKPPVVIFVASRLGADLLSEAITASTGLKALSIHGEKAMSERREVLRLFLTGEVSIVVSTGILGRGIDLLKVRQVVIFDMPTSLKEYVHQVGRASSMGEDGAAIAFINDDDKKLFQELFHNLKSAGAAIPRELANSHYVMGGYPIVRQQKRRKCGA